MGSNKNNRSVGRRDFLKYTATASALLTTIDPLRPFVADTSSVNNTAIPWYQKITRWGQVNITEKDPQQYDVNWWKKYWKKTNTQGVIINAGGIVAYYPSKVPLHRQAEFLNGMDLFGILTKAAHEEGLAVFARMDSNRAHQEAYKAQPGWFTRDKKGNPYKAGELFLSCIFSSYYTGHIPSILTEIATAYKPEGFTDNSWSGITRDMICYCENCKQDFRIKTGKELPGSKNWDDAIYQQWIHWNYARRIEIWELNNKITKKAGGEHCIWSGMNSGSIVGQSRAFRNFREISRRADILMLDHQARGSSELFQHNTEVGLMVHGLLGWNKLMPESMAMYQAGNPTFRISSKPAVEARMWMINGIAGGIQPWWHHISAYHEDRRMYDTAGPVLDWHKKNEQFLINRTPVANVGVLWSQTNADFFGRDDTDEKVEQPWKGIVRALLNARIPYLPVHADDLGEQGKDFDLLILPNVGIITKTQSEAIRKFVNDGGSILATGDTSLYDENGNMLNDYLLADIFGVHRPAGNKRADFDKEPKMAWGASYHTYLRIHPEMRKNVDGPVNGKEPTITGTRHPILKGFEKTDILPFGGFVELLNADQNVLMPLTFIPQFPVYPPETAWMREQDSGIAAVYLHEKSNGSRVTFLPAPIDSLYGDKGLPDHGQLLINIIQWSFKNHNLLQVEGPGLISCVVYKQQARMIVHLVNQTSEAAWQPPANEMIAVGPLKIKLRLSQNVTGKDIRLTVAEKRIESIVKNGWIEFTIPSLLEHEMIVIR